MSHQTLTALYSVTRSKTRVQAGSHSVFVRVSFSSGIVFFHHTTVQDESLGGGEPDLLSTLIGDTQPAAWTTPSSPMGVREHHH